MVINNVITLQKYKYNVCIVVGCLYVTFSILCYLAYNIVPCILRKGSIYYNTRLHLLITYLHHIYRKYLYRCMYTFPNGHVKVETYNDNNQKNRNIIINVLECFIANIKHYRNYHNLNSVLLQYKHDMCSTFPSKCHY